MGTRIAHGRSKPGRAAGLLPAAGAWAAAAAGYGAAQAASSWLAFRAAGDRTRPQYDQLARPAFAPPGIVFPVVWSGLNLTTATSAWRLWRSAPDAAGADRARREALAWWGAGVLVRSGYVPLAFGGRRLWAATADSALLCAVLARYAVLARRADPAAAALALPEVAWTAFATVLSAAVARKNS
jgi:benzodiazapine receptor